MPVIDMKPSLVQGYRYLDPPPPLGPNSRPTPSALWWSQGGGCCYERGTPVPILHEIWVDHFENWVEINAILITGVPRSQENATPQDPTVGACTGSYGGRWG